MLSRKYKIQIQMLFFCFFVAYRYSDCELLPRVRPLVLVPLQRQWREQGGKKASAFYKPFFVHVIVKTPHSLPILFGKVH
jgi:hypothetical protein